MKTFRKIFTIALIILFFITLLSGSLITQPVKKSEVYNSFVNLLRLNYKPILDPLVDIKDSLEVELVLKERIAKVENFFQNYNAVIKGYGEIIVRKAYECGGDYKVLVGIAGNESGLGRIPYKLYNPYGYLNNYQYSGWDESLNVLSCEISRKFLSPCNNDLTCIINRYGGPDTDKEHWIRSVSWFIRQVE